MLFHRNVTPSINLTLYYSQNIEDTCDWLPQLETRQKNLWLSVIVQATEKKYINQSQTDALRR